MLHLFKKKTETQDIDSQIQESVYSAQDLLLEEAQKVLNEPTPEITEFTKQEIDRLEKLRELGFTSTKQTQKLDQLKAEKLRVQREKKEKEDLSRRIEYYSFHYPQHKFIDDKTVNNICEKYGLVLAEASDLIDDIPEENQEEIVNFKIKKKDARAIARHVFSNINGQVTTEERCQIPFEPKEDEHENPDKHFIKMHERRRAEMMAGLSGLGGRGVLHSDFSRETLEADKDDLISGQSLQIIAPQSKINMEGKEVRGNKVFRQVKDPIVLQPVAEGFLIVTSWGFEANDDQVKNPNKN